MDDKAKRMIEWIVKGEDIRVRLEGHSIVVESYKKGEFGMGARGIVRADVTEVESIPEMQDKHIERLKHEDAARG
jgi:hypothetical protein